MHETAPNLKTFLENLTNLRLVYEDDQGKEFPLESDKDLLKAIEISKVKKQKMKIIFYYDKPESETIAENPSVSTEKVPLESSSKPVNITSEDSVRVKSEDPPEGDEPPKWFKNYMKTFNKKLKNEIQSTVHRTVYNATRAEIVSLSKNKPIYFSCESCKTIFGVLPVQRKESKKSVTDISKQRETKKTSTTNVTNPSSKSESKDVSDQRHNVLDEARRKFVERKFKLEKESGKKECNATAPKLFNFFDHNLDFFLYGKNEFEVTMYFANKGTRPWEEPWMQFCDMNGLYPNHPKILLPKLKPREASYVTIKGTVGQAVGFYYFECEVFDGDKRIVSKVRCWANVESAPESENLSKTTPDEKRFVWGLALACTENLINCRREIEQNKQQIERKLKEIERMGQISNSVIDANTKNKDVKTKEQKQNDCTSGFSVVRPTANEGKLINGGVCTCSTMNGAPCTCGTINRPPCTCANRSLCICGTNNSTLRFWTTLNKMVNSYQADIEKSEEKVQKKDETNNASGPSTVRPSAEDVASKNQSVSDSAQLEDCGKVEASGQDCLKPAADSVSGSKVSGPNETGQKQVSSIKNRQPPSREDASELKNKKIRKPSSTEYRFTAANLTQPTFSQTQEKVVSKFTFTGEKREEKSSTNEGGEKFTQNKEKEEVEKEKASTSDPPGKTIPAVSGDGRCSPAKGEDDSKTSSESPNENSKTSQTEPLRLEKKINEVFKEVPAVSAVPTRLVTGASSVASRAFNTAKSVVSNLFTGEKIEMKKDSSEEVSQEYLQKMVHLVDMGFADLKQNEELLETYNNDMEQVLQELLNSKEN